MGRIRRGNLVLVTWKGDHGPRHVHVWQDGELIVKWNLEKGCAIEGYANARVRRLLVELTKEGRL